MNIFSIKNIGKFIKAFGEAKEDLDSKTNARLKKDIKNDYRESKGKRDKSNRRLTD